MEASDGSVVDHREGYGGHTTSCGEVDKERGEGDGGAAHQSPRGIPTSSGQAGLVTEPPTGAHPG